MEAAMDMDARKKAQQRVDRIASFRSELAELEREGALNLTPEQRSRLDAHYGGLLSGFQQQFGVDVTDSGKQVSWGMRVASLLGGAALIAALVLFLHRIWGNLPATVQVAILTGAPLALLAGAEAAFARQADRYYVGLLALAAGVTFVMELNALGSVLNLADSPHVLLGWGLFALLVAYAHGLRLMLGAGLVLLCAYSAALVLSFQGYYWAGFMQRTQLLIPGALLLYCIPWMTRGHGSDDFEFVYRACGAGTGLSALLLLSTSGDLCCGGLRPGAVEATYQIVGLFFSAGVVFHGVRLSRKGLVNLGVAAFIVFLFVRLHAWWWHWMPKYLFFLLIGLTAIGLLLVFRRIRTRLLKGAVV
jgi:uncharacterized membrane protein